MMLKYFEHRREKRILNEAFKVASATSAWICIECIERNEQFFLENFDLLEKGKQNINRGMEYQKVGHNRAAYNFFMDFINEILRDNPDLINGYEELAEAKNRVLDLTNNTISPLFAKLDAVGKT